VALPTRLRKPCPSMLPGMGSHFRTNGLVWRQRATHCSLPDVSGCDMSSLGTHMGVPGRLDHCPLRAVRSDLGCPVKPEFHISNNNLMSVCPGDATGQTYTIRLFRVHLEVLVHLLNQVTHLSAGLPCWGLSMPLSPGCLAGGLWPSKLGLWVPCHRWEKFEFSVGRHCRSLQNHRCPTMWAQPAVFCRVPLCLASCTVSFPLTGQEREDSQQVSYPCSEDQGL
jgi:hypothetical protein